MAWSFNPFTGNLDLVGAGALVFEGEVETFADLPETVGDPAVGASFLVRSSTGVWLVNRRQAGIWIRRNNTGVRATDWEYGGDYPVNSVNGQTGNVSLTASDVGLGNVDNTSDTNKPVSAATQTALNAKANLTDLPDDYTVVTTAGNLTNGDRVAANTTSAAFTLTLPASPANGDTIYVLDYAGTFASNNLTIARNGNNIESLAEDLVCNVEKAAFSLVYAGSTVGWKVVPQTAVMPSTSLANTWQVNQTFNGTNNVAPNQTAASGSSLMTRALADQRLLDSLWSGRITRYTLTGWRTAVTGGGFVRVWADGQSGLLLRCGTAGGSAVAVAAGVASPPIFSAAAGGDVRFINYSQRFRVFVKFAETLGLTTNGFYYLRFDQAPGVTPAIGDPTARSIGFKVTHLSGVNGQLFGVVHDGTNLSTSVASFATINNRVSHALVIDSLGNGTVNFFLNGTLVGTMTGGPTGNTTSGINSPHFGVSSGGDVVDVTLQVADLQVMVGDF